MTVDIYDEAGSLDYDKAREAVKASSHVSNDAIRSRQLDEIATAAVIDIAASLNIVALEASLAIGPLDTDNVSQLYGLTDRDGSDAGVTEDEVDEATRDFLVVTDLVHVVGSTEPGEVVGLGFDQGETYADVVFVGGKQERFYIRNLVRIIGDEAPEEVVEEIADAVAAEIPEDPDDDFEAPVKKSGKKGGKK